MMPLINILSGLRSRRETAPVRYARWHNVGEIDMHDGAKLFRWIHKNTKGRFAYNFNILRFQDEVDAIMFKLSYA